MCTFLHSYLHGCEEPKLKRGISRGCSPDPLHGVLLDGVGVDGADHFGVLTRAHHHIGGDVGDAESEDEHDKK